MRVSKLFALTALALAMMPVYSADLLSLYREAAAQDPGVASAKASVAAARERIAQAQAADGFTAGVSAGATANYGDVHVRGLSAASSDRGYLNGSVTASASKPLIRPANKVALEQAKAAAALTEISLAAAQQDVATRLSQAYFDVLLAQDNLILVRSQKAAVGEQLAQAKRNFEVGTSTIVDTNEAQARFDQVLAQEIAANNEVDRTRWALRNVVGRFETNLKRLRAAGGITAPNPANMEAWVTRAEREAYSVRTAQQSMAVSEFDIKRAQTGKDWTLDATANVTHGQSTGSLSSGRGSWTTSGLVGVNFNLPFDVSGAVDARIREALANVDKAKNDIEAARRTAGFNVRQSYLGVTSGAASVAAQQQALKSAETLLASTKLGLEVGVRTNLDVLNAQQQVTQVQRDLAQARYNTLLNELRLKAAAGVLSEDDIRATNAFLAD
ncbi:MAG: channel protein TolC [Burkholderiales bacterium]|nr:MAG: channel protein TolC [Betaproteobacteria bacterium]TAG24655.1 MAG: channel protein TolC [Burkholderiales bacterium]